MESEQRETANVLDNRTFITQGNVLPGHVTLVLHGLSKRTNHMYSTFIVDGGGRVCVLGILDATPKGSTVCMFSTVLGYL